MPIDHVHALPPGTRFEEYRLDAVLGAGGFGITYRAYDANLDKFVAIKEYLPVEFATRTEASTVVPHSNADAQDYHWGLTRFLDEARTLARFDHTHLNKVHRFFESNGTAYMVLEYIHGETLADRLSRELYLEETTLMRLLEEVLSGLAVMHEAGYVHRDIKPGNLMLREEDGSAVVLDFGAARQAVGQRSKPITSILTPGYAPIEQYDSKADDVGPWSDIYALGMVAYRCISGLGDSELPDAVTRGRTQRKGQVDLLSAVEAGKGRYSPKLLEAIDWAMAVDEGDRPQGVEAWRQALAGGSRRKSPPRSVRKEATRPTRGTTTARTGMRWSSVALIMVIVALLGAGGWWGWQAYPEWFGRAPIDVIEVAEQEAQAGVETAPPQATETGDALASAEGTLPPDREEIEQPASKEPELSVEQTEVARLLAAAEADLKARRLTSPVGNNAWDKYQRVLELEPTNPEAVKGIERVIESYGELFAAALAQEDFEQAAAYLERIRGLHPDSPVLLTGRQRLEDARQVRAARLAEIERQRQAEEAAKQAELERQRIAQAMEAHWAAFAAALQAEDLDEAESILVQVRALNPDEPGLAAGGQRLAAARAELERQRIAQAIGAHWAAFAAALEEEDFEAAAGYLAEVRGLDPAASGMAAGEQRLAQARQTAETRRALVGEMASIPGGTFRMGDLSGDGFDWEKPVHSVTVPAFMLGKYEVTVGQFRRFVEATEYRTDAERNAEEGCFNYTGKKWESTPGISWRNPGYSVGDDQPVVCVSWNDVQSFIEWLTAQSGESYRLPSEAEWEYAARAGSATKYHFGNSESQLCRYGNHADSSTDFDWRNESCSDGVGKRTAAVGRYQPNSYGLYDMHGNVWEWVADCWNDSYAGAPSDGRAWELGDCSRRVIRGGSWFNLPRSLRSAARNRGPRAFRNYFIGFRLVQDP